MTATTSAPSPRPAATDAPAPAQPQGRARARRAALTVPYTALLVGLFVLATVLVPLQGGYYLDAAAPVMLVVCVLAALLVAGGALVRERLGGVRGFGMACAGAFMVWTFVAVSWSASQHAGYLQALLTALYTCAIVAAVALSRSRSAVHAAAMASVLLPAAVAMAMLWQLPERTAELFLHGRMTGMLGYFNAQAALLVMPLPVALTLAARERLHPLLRGLVLGAGTLALLVAVLAQSRGAMVALACMLVVLFAASPVRLRLVIALVGPGAALALGWEELNAVYAASRAGGPLEPALAAAVRVAASGALLAAAWGLTCAAADRRVRVPRALRNAAAGGLVAVVVLAVAAGAIGVQRDAGGLRPWLAERWAQVEAKPDTATTSRYTDMSNNGRIELWRVAWHDVESRPLTGIGPGAWEGSYYRNREENVGTVRQPHFLALELAAERGLVGLLLFAGLVLAAALRLVQLRRGSTSRESAALAAAFAAAAAYWLAHSQLEWFWQYPAVTLPAMLYLGMLLGAPWRLGDAAPPARPVRLAVAAVCVAAAVAVLPPYIAGRHLQAAADAASPAQALKSAALADRFWPHDPTSAQLGSMAALRSGDHAEARRLAREQVRRDPRHYMSYVFAADVLAAVGSHEEARRMRKKARRLDPLNA